MSDLFVVTFSQVGQLWLGKVHEASFTSWRNGATALHIKNPRALIPIQSKQENAQSLMIGPIYHGDTAQEDLYVSNIASVEVVGEIEKDERTGVETCTKNNSLFMQYLSAVDQWKEACSGFQLASAQDLNNINNTIPFPQK